MSFITELLSNFYRRFAVNRHKSRLIGAVLVANFFLVFLLTRFLITASTPLIARDYPKSKIILLWSPWFGDLNWTNVFRFNKGPLIELGDDSKRRCFLTTDRNRLDEADALLFHGRDYDPEDDPKTRRHDQRWVFFSLEPPSMTFTDQSWLWLNNVSTFNWTISYSSKADIRFPYGRLISKPPQSSANLNKTAEKIAKFVRDFSNKKKDAVWIVSHCDTLSKREVLVERLEKLGLTIDKFGFCSDQKAPLWNPENGDFFAKYRFYLAFENSVCDDYVSEKLFRALNLSSNFGVIPVAYHGDVNYAGLGVPQEAFIDVRKFLPNNLTGLVKYLKTTLPNDLLQLADFYSWQFLQKVDPFPFAFKWQNLCAALWQQEINDDQEIHDVRQTFGKCDENPSDDSFW